MSKKEKVLWVFLLMIQLGVTGWVWIEPRMTMFVRSACLFGFALLAYLWNYRRMTAI